MDDTVSTRRLFYVLALALLAFIPVAPTGCAQYIGTTARSFLNTIRDDPDPNVRYLAYSKLASRQCYEMPNRSRGRERSSRGSRALRADGESR